MLRAINWIWAEQTLSGHSQPRITVGASLSFTTVARFIPCRVIDVISRLHSSWPSVWLPHIPHQASVPTLHRDEYKTILVNRGRGEDGTEFSPFASVLGPAGAERCQAGHVALPALRPRSPLPSFGHPTLFNEFQSPACTFVISATKSNRGPSSRIFSEFPKSFNVGVVPWGSAIQKFEKRSLDLDGSTKSKNKAGHSGKDLSIACNAARFAGPRSKIKIERLNERNHVCNSSSE